MSSSRKNRKKEREGNVVRDTNITKNCEMNEEEQNKKKWKTMVMLKLHVNGKILLLGL